MDSRAIRFRFSATLLSFSSLFLFFLFTQPLAVAEEIALLCGESSTTTMTGTGRGVSYWKGLPYQEALDQARLRCRASAEGDVKRQTTVTCDDSECAWCSWCDEEGKEKVTPAAEATYTSETCLPVSQDDDDSSTVSTSSCQLGQFFGILCLLAQAAGTTEKYQCTVECTQELNMEASCEECSVLGWSAEAQTECDESCMSEVCSTVEDALTEDELSIGILN